MDVFVKLTVSGAVQADKGVPVNVAIGVANTVIDFITLLVHPLTSVMITLAGNVPLET